jgi:pilus assembly protein Flp/PilA
MHLTFCDRIQSCVKDCRYNDRMKTIRKFLADESGATAIEYGLIAAGIALAVISAVQGVGTKLKTNFGTISTSLK